MYARKLSLAALPFLAFAFAACSSDEDTATAPVTPAKSISEVVVEDARFGTLEAAVKAAQVATLDKASTALGKDVAIAVRDGTIHVIDGVLLPPQ